MSTARSLTNFLDHYEAKAIVQGTSVMFKNNDLAFLHHAAASTNTSKRKKKAPASEVRDLIKRARENMRKRVSNALTST